MIPTDRITQILLTTQFKPGDKDDPESCARIIAQAIVDDMETHEYEMSCLECRASNHPCGDCPNITIKGFRVVKQTT